MLCLSVILAAVLFNTLFSRTNLNSVETAASQMNEVDIRIQQLYDAVGKRVETVQKYANILIGSSDEDLAIAGDIYGNLDADVNAVKELLAELQTVSSLRKNNDFVGAKVYMGTDALNAILSQEQTCLALEEEFDKCLKEAQTARELKQVSEGFVVE